MIIARKHSIWVRLILIFSIFTVVTIIDWTTPVLKTWNARFFDILFAKRSSSSLFAPEYDDTVVHVNLDDTSIQQLQSYYLNRSHHAEIITNLANMGVSAQLHDVIFVAPTNRTDDAALLEAVKNSKDVYFGLAFRLSQNVKENVEEPLAPDIDSYMAESSWKVQAKGDTKYFFLGQRPLMTFSELARASRGLGFLNLTADHDGIFRRIPLVVRYKDAYYPSVPFRLICDYLGVEQSEIIIEPGERITLLNPVKPGGKASERIDIPIDKQGNMIINFIGPWDRLKHYHFADVLRASESQSVWNRWVEELSDKIVIVSEVTTGSTDVGSVPTDIAYPLSGVSASVIHTILSESFIRESPLFVTLIIEAVALAAVFCLSLLSSTLFFTISVLGVACLMLLTSALLFLKVGFITQVIAPVIMVLLAYLTIQIVRALDNARSLKQSELKRNMFEREMEIGRQIQAGFFPEKLPDISGWELAAFFRPTRQVSGDFYDAFFVADGKLIGFVVADVCDKGVGAALFMALTRSLLRAFTLQNLNESEIEPEKIGPKLQHTIRLTNDYIAETHGNANMFATLFVGLLDPDSGTLFYTNCGHEPPIVKRDSDKLIFMKPTGPALGMFPAIKIQTKEILLLKGDMLLAFTDGVTDAQNDKGVQFTTQKVVECLEQESSSAESLVASIVKKVDDHVADAQQFDDITLMAIKKIRQ